MVFTERGNVTQTFREALQTRLNNPDRSAIVVIMQRLHQDDVSGVILKDFPEFTHLMLPMRFEPSRRCKTKIGFVDPRMEEGDLLFPSRFPAKTVTQLERGMGVYAAAGQLQQRPEPRGGGILKRTSWSTWDEKAAEELGITSGKFPPFDFIAASIDTAYTEKEENDQSAITIWGVFRDKKARPQLMLVYAWAERVEFNDLVEKIEALAKKWRVDELWIESKAAGISVAQEIRRRMDNLDFRWVTHLIDPGRIDKQARAYAVQGILDSGDVWAPATRWADLVINQCAVFPKGSHDDLVDTVTQALRRFRAMNFLPTDREDEHEILEMKKHVKRERPLYDA
jgi:predicted phage terminase large subunit-like protein